MGGVPHVEVNTRIDNALPGLGHEVFGSIDATDIARVECGEDGRRKRTRAAADVCPGELRCRLDPVKEPAGDHPAPAPDVLLVGAPRIPGVPGHVLAPDVDPQ
jgi:hypothetical protein